jgi:hypothetical protein
MTSRLYRLKVSRAVLVLLIAIVGLTSAFLTAILPQFIQNVVIESALIVFIDGLASALIVFLSTELANTPPVQKPA